MTHWTSSLCGGTIAMLVSGVCLAQTAAPASRGQLLYTTHCVACHNTQVHWRANKVADNWISLRKEVGRWQGVANLQWSEEDITLVARYLNDTIYNYPVDTLAQRE